VRRSPGPELALEQKRPLARLALEWAVPEAISALEPDRAAREEIAAGFRVDAGSWVRLRVHADDAGLTVLARGLAAMAFRPGGVSYLGLSWVAVAAQETGQAAA
jgi:hypothetical protein